MKSFFFLLLMLLNFSLIAQDDDQGDNDGRLESNSVSELEASLQSQPTKVNPDDAYGAENEALMNENEQLAAENERLRANCQCGETQAAQEQQSPVVIINELPQQQVAPVQQEATPLPPRQYNSDQYTDNYQYYGPSTFPPINPMDKWPVR